MMHESSLLVACGREGVDESEERVPAASALPP